MTKGSFKTLSTSDSLLDRVKSHDREAWNRFSDLYCPLVYRWARQAGLQDDDAADVVQEVFLQVSQAISSFQHHAPGHTFCGWLRIITRNQICEHFRRLPNEPRGEGGSDALQRFVQLPMQFEQDLEPDGFDAATHLAHQALDFVRGDFSPQTWQAFWRLTVDGHTAADIGADLNMTPKAVRQAKFRVLVRLRQELAGN